MCGIAGFVDFGNNLFPQGNKERFASISADLLSRRGPDSHSHLKWNEGQSEIQFLHTRLSIIDLSDHANQPFLSKDERYAMVFNGEIYNYIELREQLKNKTSFRTSSDTEVLLEAYIEWGLDMFSKLEGMFAGAIFDRNEKKVHFFRDHIGIKPFYYYLSNHGVAFSSEPKVIRNTIPATNALNGRNASTYIMYGVSDYREDTFFKGIDQLMPGERLTIDLRSNSVEKKFYYDPKAELRKGEEVSPNDYSDLIKDIVKLQLRSDVQVGTSLSGGIDSGLIATLIGEVLGDNASSIKSLTYVAPGFENDESQFAKDIASKAGLNWIPVEFGLDNFVEDFKALVDYMEEPFGSLSIFAQFNIMKQARMNGCKVMLDGQGGDELYLGYPRLAQRIIFDSLTRGRLLTAFSEWYWATKRQEMSPVYPILSNLYFNMYSASKSRKLNFFSKLIDKEFLLQYDDESMRDFFSPKSLKEKQVDEFHKYILPRLLKYADRNSMFHSVESRVPHLAQRNVDYSLKLKNKHKINKGWTKYIVRKAFSERMPSDVIWQTKKIGFDTPQGEWLNQVMDYLIEELDDCGGILNKTELINYLKDPKLSMDHGVFRVLSFALSIKRGSIALS